MQSKVLKKTLESISFDFRRGTEEDIPKEEVVKLEATVDSMDTSC